MSAKAGRIDLHQHFTPDFLREVMLGNNLAPTSGVFPLWSPQIALDFMDEHGVGASVISISHPGVHFGDPRQAVDLARRSNEVGAMVSTRWPDRFGAFMTTPLPDVDPALAEIEYGFDTLKLDGICLLASYRGKFLGDPLFDPVLAELDRRKAVCFIHPSAHPTTSALGLPWPIFVMEFLFDTTRAVVNMLFNGTLDKYPNIRFILAHAGGLVPYFSWRLSVAPMISPLLPQWEPERILASLRRFWYDTALSAGRQTMGTLSEVADPSRIVFGSDWPPAGTKAVKASIAALQEPHYLSEAQRRAIERDNALALFPRLT